MSRYSRQICVRGVGTSGQSKIENARVVISGSGLGAEVCALYLAGAGLGHLEVHSDLVDRIRALNSSVRVESGVVNEDLAVSLNGVSMPVASGSSVERGSRLARDVLAALLVSGDDMAAGQHST